MAEVAPTADELALYDEISQTAEGLWAKSTQISGLNTDPKMFSIMLFKRLRSHHRGFTLLWNERLYTDADILLRAGIEAAICIAANFELRERFVAMMRSDAAFTLTGQIKLHRAAGDRDLVRDGEATLRDLQRGLSSKAAKLDWADLAEQGKIPQLYTWHKMLSGVSSHITGLSLLRGVVSDDQSTQLQSELKALTRKMHLMMMAGATIQGSILHAGMIDDADTVEHALSLMNRMSALSWDWPGVERTEHDVASEGQC